MYIMGVIREGLHDITVCVRFDTASYRCRFDRSVPYPPVRYPVAEVPQTEINSQRGLCQVVIGGGLICGRTMTTGQFPVASGRRQRN